MKRENTSMEDKESTHHITGGNKKHTDKSGQLSNLYDQTQKHT